jgi:sec-independent protein translocase protein TatC
MAIPAAHPDRMTIWEHLQELRTRLVRSVIVVVATFAVIYAFRFRIWTWAQQPFLEAMARQTHKPLAELQPWAFTDLAEPFLSLMRLSLWAAAFVAAPFLFYQLWAFIRPALRERERRMVIPFVLVTSAMFLGGAAFAYCEAFKFLGDILFQEATRAGLRANMHIDSYLDLFLYTLLITGVMFEMPVLAYFLAKFRLITARWLLKFWRHSTIVILLVSAFMTPGDVVATMVFFSVILEVLYFVSVVVVWVVQPRKPAQP